MDQPIYKRRLDLINSLPWGGLTRMTKIVDISLSVISKVLNGKLNANTETNRHVIILAEQMVNREKQLKPMGNKKYQEPSELHARDRYAVADKITESSNFNIGLHDYSNRF